jgi:diguanylate cyclase (GGDEF)-like protein
VNKLTTPQDAGANAQPAIPEAAKFDPFRCFTTIAKLPGVVVYQRLVTPDQQIRYTYISEGAKDLFGVSADEIVTNPRALFATHSADYSARFRERLLDASRTMSTWDVEASILTRDGRKKYTHATALPERLPDGSVLWTGIIQDETRVRTALIEGIALGFLLYDAHDKLVMRNGYFEKLFPSIAAVAVPGVSYRDIIRAELTHDGLASPVDAADPKLDELVGERVRKHKDNNSMYELELKDGRWILVNEHMNEEGSVVIYADITEIKAGQNQIKHLAFHDPLTGLPNRMLFNERLVEALESPDGSSIAAMCLDLDHFKIVNDTLGHPIGDALLKYVSAQLKGCLDEQDTVARLGGDEFGVIVRNATAADLNALASRLLDAVNHPTIINGHQLAPAMSIGIALSSDGMRDPGQLMKNADLALYRAKSDGRGTFRYFEPEMDAIAQERRLLEMDLRQAVAQGNLVLHYQPQVDVVSDDILGFEALVRWPRAGRGLVPPSDFIPLAEEVGLISKLGEWVVRQACKDAVNWPEHLRVSVNISPAQFKNGDVIGVVAKAIADSGISPDRLELEITESLLLRDTEENLEILAKLKALGVRISMDDFGTGYSSLGNLRSFAFDKIKIDRSFVMDLERSLDSAAIIRAVIGLGNSLGIATCAEGVETKDQLQFLRDEGCAEVQGYYHSKPRPKEDIEKMIAERVQQRMAG